MGAESFPHILIPRILLVDQVICCRYVVVSVCLQTPNRVVFFKAVVLDQLGEKVLLVGHFLETWEEAWLSRLICEVFYSVTHEWMTADVSNTIACFGVGV